MLPDSELSLLEQETKVDFQVKKLSGRLIFKLLLYGLLSGKELSWRILEVLIHSHRFGKLAGLSDDFSTDHSSLGERVSHMEVAYFEKLFNRAIQMMSEYCPAQEIANYKLIRYDSTFVNIASTLLKIGGMSAGVNTRKMKDVHPVAVKFSVGFDGMQLKNAKMFHTDEYMSDDISLRELILEGTWDDKEIAVFDRAVQSRDSFDKFSENQIKFVARLRRSTNGNIKYKKVRDITIIQEDDPIETETLYIQQDIEVFLYRKSGRKTRSKYRLIFARMKSNNEPIVFLSNMLDQISVEDITEIYKRRWDIEVFFKHIKQEFGFKHFLSRNENGIQVMLYMTLIAAMLIFVYQHLNKIEGIKIAKLWFINELDEEIMRIVVQMCRGNPDLMGRFSIF